MDPRIGLVVLLVVAAAPKIATAQNEKCDNEQCGWGATCKMVNGRPRCRCNEFCPMVHKPVCGSDGKTYINYCGMKQAGCHQQEELVKVQDGQCPKIVTESSDETGTESSIASSTDGDYNAGEGQLAPGELRKQTVVAVSGAKPSSAT